MRKIENPSTFYKISPIFVTFGYMLCRTALGPARVLVIFGAMLLSSSELISCIVFFPTELSELSEPGVVGTRYGGLEG